MQGYYFSRPVSYNEIVALLQQEQNGGGLAQLESAV